MKKETIYNAFVRLFPTWSKMVTGYKKIGSRMILIDCLLYNDKSIVFLYNNDNDWTLGTKIWRRRPEPKKKDQKENNHE